MRSPLSESIDRKHPYCGNEMWSDQKEQIEEKVQMYAFFESSKQYFLESVNGISWKSEIGISLAQNQKPHEINHAVFDKKAKTSFIQRIVAFDKF